MEPHLPAGPIGNWLFVIPAGRFYVYKQLPDYFGTREAEARAGMDTEHFLRRIHAQDRRILAEEAHRAIATGDRFDLTYRLHTPNRSTRLLRAVGRCRFDPSGRVATLFGGEVFDVTPLAKEDLIRLASRRIEAARRMVAPERRPALDCFAALAQMEIEDMAGD